jgi:hypothetical protein
MSLLVFSGILFAKSYTLHISADGALYTPARVWAWPERIFCSFLVSFFSVFLHLFSWL